MRSQLRYGASRAVWRRFHPIVRIGWYVATTGDKRPAAQTAIGAGMIVFGLAARRSQKSSNTPIYVHTVSPGQTTRIRVYRGTSAPSEVTLRT